MIQDEPESVAGTGKGPTPTDFLIASVAFCENVVFARNAVLNDLDIQALETTASGDWDMKGLFEKVVEVARMTHRRCPVHATLNKATKMTFKLFVNDVDTPL